MGPRCPNPCINGSQDGFVCTGHLFVWCVNPFLEYQRLGLCITPWNFCKALYPSQWKSSDCLGVWTESLGQPHNSAVRQLGFAMSKHTQHQQQQQRQARKCLRVSSSSSECERENSQFERRKFYENVNSLALEYPACNKEFNPKWPASYQCDWTLIITLKNESNRP